LKTLENKTLLGTLLEQMRFAWKSHPVS